MGDIAEMMLDGQLCEGCGASLPGAAPGYPRYCSTACRRDRTFLPTKHAGKKKVHCPTCQKKVKATGLNDHIRDAHTNKEI